MTKEVAEFWNEKDTPTRKEIVKVLSGYLNVPVSSFLVEVDFDGLPVLQKNILKNYFEQHILPQKGQQICFDGIIHEKMPPEFKCPRCGAPAKQVMETKRGIHFRCTNVACDYDTNQPFDLSKEGRKRHIIQCMNLLKKMFPQFNFVSNFPYTPNALLTGIIKKGKTNYDIKCILFGNLIQRTRCELNYHLTQEQFMETERDVYVIGRKSVVEYLADPKRDGLCIHYLIDEPDEKKKIGLSRLKIIKENCPVTPDGFGNLQFTLVKSVRPLIVTFNPVEMHHLLTRNLYHILYRNLKIK